MNAAPQPQPTSERAQGGLGSVSTDTEGERSGATTEGTTMAQHCCEYSKTHWHCYDCNNVATEDEVHGFLADAHRDLCRGCALVKAAEILFESRQSSEAEKSDALMVIQTIYRTEKDAQARRLKGPANPVAWSGKEVA